MNSGQQNQFVESENCLGNSSLYSQGQPIRFHDSSNTYLSGQFIAQDISLDQLMADSSLDYCQTSQLESINYEFTAPSLIVYPQEQLLENISCENKNKMNIEQEVTEDHIQKDQYLQSTFQTQLYQHDQTQQPQFFDQDQLCNQLLGLSNIPPQKIRSNYLCRAKLEYIDKKIEQIEQKNLQFLLKVYRNNNFQLFQKYRPFSNQQKKEKQLSKQNIEVNSTLNLSLKKFQMPVFSGLNWKDLINLDLSTSFLNDTDWKKLVQNFKNFSQLKKLLISNNMITEIYKKDIEKMTKSAPSLNHVNLLKNPLNMFSMDQLNQAKSIKLIKVQYNEQMMKFNQSQNGEIEEFSQFLGSQCSCYTFQSVDQIEVMDFVKEFCNQYDKQTEPKTAASSSIENSQQNIEEHAWISVNSQSISLSFKTSDIHSNQNKTLATSFSQDYFTQNLISEQISTMIQNRQLKPQSNLIRQIFEKLFSNGLCSSIGKYFDDFKTNMRQKTGLKSEQKEFDQIVSDQIDKFKDELSSKIQKYVSWATQVFIDSVVNKTNSND